MLDPIKVKAPSGNRYPLEGMPSKHVAGGGAVEVPDTAYYRKAISDGDLILVDAPAAAAPVAPTAPVAIATLATFAAPPTASAAPAPVAAPAKAK